MASIYKRKRDKGRRHAPYWIQYFDHDGRRRTKKGFTDKGLTEQLAAKLENEALLRSRGMIDAKQEALNERQASPIEEHLAAFERSLVGKANTEKHVGLAMSRIRRIVDGCGFQTLGDLDPDSVEEFLVELREEEDIGFRTHNHYVQAIDGFCRWLVSKRRLASNPLAGLPRLNAEADVRRRRRALTAEEMTKLIESARTSGLDIQGYSPELRARVYTLAYFTGLRRKELASLTPRSFTLGSTPPTATVEAACSKHRKEDVLPLHPELISVLPGWLEGIGPDELLFPDLARKKTWFMVQKDLARVGIAYETHEGVADFHAAGRHTYVTTLLRNGVSVTEAKELARHGDIRMTMRYTHHGLNDQARAIGSLPWLHIGCSSRGGACQDVASGDIEQEGEDAGDPNKNPCESRGCDSDEHCLAGVGTPAQNGGGGNRTRKRIRRKRKLLFSFRKLRGLLRCNGAAFRRPSGSILVAG